MMFVGLLTSLLVASVAATHDTTRPAPYNCTTVTVRKEVRQMYKDGQLGLFVDAFLKLAADGTLKEFIDVHGPEVGQWERVHFSSMFLPWHRVFIKEFELLLQAQGAPYLPYWDWSLDYKEPWNSAVLSADMFGSPNPRNKSRINNGLMGNYMGPKTKNTLIRDYRAAGPTEPFASGSKLEEQKQTSTFSAFSQDFEYTSHMLIHFILGGRTGQIGRFNSPEDPLFFLHHAFCDKVWYDYVWVNPDAEFESDAYGSNVFEDTPLPHWGDIQVRDVYTLDATCVQYENLTPEMEAEAQANWTRSGDDDNSRVFEQSILSPEFVNKIVAMGGDVSVLERLGGASVQQAGWFANDNAGGASTSTFATAAASPTSIGGLLVACCLLLVWLF